MSAATWGFWLIVVIAGLVFVRWVYRRREVPGRGRGALMALRGGAVAILLLLLFDPELPGGARIRDDRAVLIDRSLSMGVAGPSGRTPWSEAVERAGRTEGEVFLFGEGAHGVERDSLALLTPVALRSQLLPALQAVAEAGRRRVTVLTDGAIEDAAEVARWLPRLGLDVEWVRVGGTVVNRGLSAVSAPPWAEIGGTVEIDFEVSATGGATGPTAVVVRAGSETLARTTVPTPAAGRLASGALRFPARPPERGEWARYDVAIEGSDAVADDDVRPVYVRISAEPMGGVLLSFRPDWEPRFLLPVLERALGMPVRGYARSGPGWVTIGSGSGVGRKAQDPEVRRAAERAELVVLHNLDAGSPVWARELARSARRLIVLPSGDGAAAEAGLAPSAPVVADWYVSDVIPPSPVAGLLADLDVSDVPPLTTLRLPARSVESWIPLMASRGRRGAPYPVALGGSTGGRRHIVALGEGYWRWAFWSDAARSVYDRLWSALAGWLIEGAIADRPDIVGPSPRAVGRGQPVRWVAPGLRPDSVRIRLTDAAGENVLDTLVAGIGSDTLATPALPPGHYGWEASAHTAGGSGRDTGELTVDSYSAEFTRPATEATVVTEAPAALASPGRGRRPMHASAWPYAVVMALLCLEWVLRRRWGLR